MLLFGDDGKLDESHEEYSDDDGHRQHEPNDIQIVETVLFQQTVRQGQQARSPVYEAADLSHERQRVLVHGKRFDVLPPCPGKLLKLLDRPLARVYPRPAVPEQEDGWYALDPESIRYAPLLRDVNFGDIYISRFKSS